MQTQGPSTKLPHSPDESARKGDHECNAQSVAAVFVSLDRNFLELLLPTGQKSQLYARLGGFLVVVFFTRKGCRMAEMMGWIVVRVLIFSRKRTHILTTNRLMGDGAMHSDSIR